MGAILVDPGPSELRTLVGLGLDVTLHLEELPRAGIRLEATASHRLGLNTRDLVAMDESALWEVHDQAVAGEGGRGHGTGGVSLLRLKQEIAARWLRHCTLCQWRCAVDRSAGERGRCGLGAGASPAEVSVHVGEEALINPSLLLPLRGCALRCRTCQQGSLLEPGEEGPLDLCGAALPPGDVALARTLSFIGGNPDESLPAILGELAARHEEVRVPVVWNTHGWVSPRALSPLHGLVDVYVTDLKFGNDSCASELAGVPQYSETVLRSIAMQAGQGVPVLVRVLVLPGHLDCCAFPALSARAELELDEVVVSLANRYVPHGSCVGVPGPLGRPISESEIGDVERQARQLGLTLARPGLEVGVLSERSPGAIPAMRAPLAAPSEEDR